MLECPYNTILLLLSVPLQGVYPAEEKYPNAPVTTPKGKESDLRPCESHRILFCSPFNSRTISLGPKTNHSAFN